VQPVCACRGMAARNNNRAHPMNPNLVFAIAILIR